MEPLPPQASQRTPPWSELTNHAIDASTGKTCAVAVPGTGQHSAIFLWFRLVSGGSDEGVDQLAPEIGRGAVDVIGGA